jgi:hypothetical protein
MTSTADRTTTLAWRDIAVGNEVSARLDVAYESAVAGTVPRGALVP